MVVKKRKIMKKDTEVIASFIKDEKARRAKTKFRMNHERIWKEVDRMVAMEAEPVKKSSNAPSQGWESNIELGSLADASEIIAADVMRIAMPSDRDFFRPHVNIPAQLDESTGEASIDVELQKKVDGVLKSLMSQQHTDFGFRDRLKLSVKEALHHGSFVAVIRSEEQTQFTGGKTKVVKAPVWVPYSMWDCYPDDSPTVIGTNIVYDGTMIIEEEIPLSMALSQPWMNLDKLKTKFSTQKKDHIKILHWYGDIHIKRGNKDGFEILNQHVIVHEEVFLLAEQNETPYPPVIFSGYERDNVLDPYYSSPLIKRAPTNKLASHMANKFVEAVDLATKPPIGYDANEPTFREGEGPEIYPGALFPLRAGGQLKTIEVADPQHAFLGMKFFKGEVEEGTGVDFNRKGVGASTEQTAFEVDKIDQKGEVRTVDFVSTLERQGIKPYLYMQHELNKLNLNTYGFYNTQLDTPDFMTMSRSELNERAKDCHFEVIGSKGVLGEERRRRGSLEVTTFFAGNELFAQHLDVQEIMQDAYRSVGQKDPERFLTFEDEEDPALAELQEQAAKAVEILQKEIEDLKLKVAEIPLLKANHKAQLSGKEAQAVAFRAENKILEEQIQLQAKADSREKQLFSAEKRLMVLKDIIGDDVLRLKLAGTANDKQITAAQQSDLSEKESELKQLTKLIDEDRADREELKGKVVGFIDSNGSLAAKELVKDL